MKRRVYLSVGALALAVGGAWWWRGGRRVAAAPTSKFAQVANAVRRAAALPNPGASTPRPVRAPAAEDKAAAIARIKRDYDEMRTKVASDYAAAGPAFPGGLNGFLRQLALLERERRADYLKVLTPQELEELELRESHAGDVVRTLLGDTAATPEQRRAAFELQREFDDKYALTFDLSPAFLLARERDRQAMQEQVRTVLGDALFGSWLRGEGKEFAVATAFAAQHGSSPDLPLALWRLRNQYALARLEVSASPAASTDDVREANAALARKAEADARTLLGAAADDPAAGDLLSWLPKP